MGIIVSSRIPCPAGVTSETVFSTKADLMNEAFFRKMLVMEQKRSKRSNRSFMLMLLDISALHDAPHCTRIVNTIARILHTNTRETDFKGWYAQGSVVGIIFTEMDRTNVEPILDKIKGSVSNFLDPAYFARLGFFYFIFPGDQPSDKGMFTDMNAVSVVSSRSNTTRAMPEIAFSSKADLMDEACFRKMLVIERRRSERSNRSFMLILLNLSVLRDAPAPGYTRFINNLARILHTTTRETDIKGWYAHGSIVGIIFTEIDGRNVKPILDKIKCFVSNSLDPAYYARVLVSYFIFPDDQNNDEGMFTDMNAVLYENKVNKWRMKNLLCICKRCIDILGSIFGMLLFFPIFIVISILIKCTSRGPVFFRQVRVGQYGQPFDVIKFRTMKECNDDEIHKKFVRQFIKNSSHYAAAGQKVECKIKDDPRITPIGKILRKTSLDEVPQFINVLYGSMSLVGPRPAIPYEIKEYHVWHRRRVFEVKPGLTGIWQVKGRSRTDFDNMVRMDIQYIKEWTLLMDLQIIAETPLALFSAKGAY